MPNDETDWIITRDAHPALIDRRLAEQMKQRRDSKIQSLEQRGKDPREQTGYRGTYKDGVGTPDAKRRYIGWNGKRSRFILSGLLTCSLCGNRYQGFHRSKGKKRMDGTRAKNFGYACGGYITKGTSVCQMNSFPQEVLEKTVIDAVLDFYKPCLQPGGKRKLAEAVMAQVGTQADDLDAARDRVRREQTGIESTINTLLDNLTETNREFVDARLSELRDQRDQLKQRDEELECLELAQTSIDATAQEAMEFIKKIKSTLREGVPQEKLVALRLCVARIWIDHSTKRCKIRLRQVPVGQMDESYELCVPILFQRP